MHDSCTKSTPIWRRIARLRRRGTPAYEAIRFPSIALEPVLWCLLTLSLLVCRRVRPISMPSKLQRAPSASATKVCVRGALAPLIGLLVAQGELKISPTRFRARCVGFAVLRRCPRADADRLQLEQAVKDSLKAMEAANAAYQKSGECVHLLRASLLMQRLRLAVQQLKEAQVAFDNNQVTTLQVAVNASCALSAAALSDLACPPRVRSNSKRWSASGWRCCASSRYGTRTLTHRHICAGTRSSCDLLFQHRASA